jgi:hypothetical protein
MELSEAGVKRLFSKHTFSLSRLEDVCRIPGIDFYDLVLMDKERSRIDNLIKEYNRLVEMDAALPLKGRHSTGLLIGFRPRVFTGIAGLHRRDTGGK